MRHNLLMSIGHLAQKALLYEVAATPKPGLVDRKGPGIHKDMDFFTFLDSATVLLPYFDACAMQGGFCQVEVEGVLPQLKGLGIDAEQQMFLATGGVNTHKGLIYALGLLCSAAGTVAVSSKAGLPIDLDAVSQRVVSIVSPHMAQEKAFMMNAETYGANQLKTYGLLGARGEALSGYQKARQVGLTSIEKGLTHFGFSLNDAMLYTLLALIPVVDDSNVIGRKGLAVLKESQSKAQAVIDGGHLSTETGKDLYKSYLDWSLEMGVSHGGAADMLSVSLFMWLFKTFS